jgi:hypothetical protein
MLNGQVGDIRREEITTHQRGKQRILAAKKAKTGSVLTEPASSG